MKQFLFLLTLTSINLFALEPTIVGVWHLDKWDVIAKDGTRSEFCKGAFGTLMYEQSGHVSTAINCPQNTRNVKEPADDFNRIFFYAGKYTVRDDLITKVVANASAQGLIGKTVLRRIEKLTEKELILSGPFASGWLWIRWVKK